MFLRGISVLVIAIMVGWPASRGIAETCEVDLVTSSSRGPMDSGWDDSKAGFVLTWRCRSDSSVCTTVICFARDNTSTIRFGPDYSYPQQPFESTIASYSDAEIFDVLRKTLRLRTQLAPHGDHLAWMELPWRESKTAWPEINEKMRARMVATKGKVAAGREGEFPATRIFYRALRTNDLAHRIGALLLEEGYGPFGPPMLSGDPLRLEGFAVGKTWRELANFPRMGVRFSDANVCFTMQPVKRLPTAI